MEYYSTIRRNEVLLHATWMNLGNIMLRERRQKQRPACFYLYEVFKIGKSTASERRLMVSRAWWERRNEE